ncbi:MAG: hypothetical protein C4538_02020 [Nitrospiraceae bacterium]|nr:MAG: hypothetical protein C4538_02020 [Nitrospiraceae bacterium]
MRSSDTNGTYQDIIDINGDGLPDRVTSNSSRNGSTLLVYLNNGRGFENAAIQWNTPVTNSTWKQDVRSYVSQDVSQDILDINGDGLPDRVTSPFDKVGDYLKVYPSNGPFPDLLTKIENGLGGITDIEYNPSTKYKNTYLPFVQYVVSKVTVKDGKGNLSETTFDYAGGLYSATQKEFRGFNYVKSTAPNGTVTETWFKQDDIFKGLIEAQVVKDSSSKVYSWIENTYLSYKPYQGYDSDYPYLDSIDEYIYDASATDTGTETDYTTRRTFLNTNTLNRRHVINAFTYDTYGNLASKYEGENPLQGDERTEYTEYAYDLTNYIVSLPSRKYMKDGVNTIKAQTWYRYYPDGRGNLWQKESWLDGGTNPITVYEYDTAGYGNLWKIKDPKLYVTEITYDTATKTFPTVIKNHLGHEVHKSYDSIFIDKVHIETDPNQKDTIYDYDQFGRLEWVTNPAPYGKTKYVYQNYGNPYTQNVREEAQERTGNLIHFRETYFDGIGRVTSERQGGPQATTMIVDTEYTNKGLVYQKSLPYFSGALVYEITYTYDPVDRLINTLNPDNTSSSISYNRERVTYIDANRHAKVAVKDIYDRVTSIEEYMGNSASTYVLYAQTYYKYDVLGNLKKVTDDHGNPTDIVYDTLSRKKEMIDPDMGHWYYDYDANGNLTYQKDAKNREIWFEYDVLNRVTLKNYPTGTDIVYTYDEPTSTNPKGRLTTLIDNSGTTLFYYDEMGQISKTEKTLASDLSFYRTQTQYDPLGRVKKIIYPDLTEVDYQYDGNGNIRDIKKGAQAYVTYDSYTAIGNPLSLTFGNGTTTNYTYYPESNRLKTIITTSPTAGVLMDLFYEIRDMQNNINTNIMQIIDNVNHSKDRTFKYDELDRLIEADSPSYGGKLIYQYDEIGNMTYNCKYGYYLYEDPKHKHAVTRILKNGNTVASYIYDDNGNMEKEYSYNNNGVATLKRDITYDYDNKAESIMANGNAVANQYDAFGNRIQKLAGSITKYIGQIYECTGSECSKYIFAGTQRIAEVRGADTYYYHTDHLQSSHVITDQTGANVEQVSYYPYGDMNGPHTGSVNLRYKYAGHEYEGAEIGLYYMGARYYDPKLGRFISADTIVPEPFYPQSLNRYAYAYNNPVMLRDLDGHCTPSVNCPPPSFHGSSGGIRGRTQDGGAVSRGQANANAYVTVDSNGRVTIHMQVGPTGTGSPSMVVSPPPPTPSTSPKPSTPPNINFAAIGGGNPHGSQAGSVGGHNSGGAVNSSPNNQNNVSQTGNGANQNNTSLLNIINEYGSVDITYNFGRIFGGSIQISIDGQGVSLFIGGGAGLGSGLSIAGTANFGDSYGWGGSVSVAGGNRAGGALTVTKSQGGTSVSVGVGFGMGAGASLTFGYGGKLFYW